MIPGAGRFAAQVFSADADQVATTSAMQGGPIDRVPTAAFGRAEQAASASSRYVGRGRRDEVSPCRSSIGCDSGYGRPIQHALT